MNVTADTKDNQGTTAVYSKNLQTFWDLPKVNTSFYGSNTWGQNLQEILTEVNALKELEDDWDGEDAPKISQNAISLAHSLVSKVYHQARLVGIWREPIIAPRISGGIGVSWQAGHKRIHIIIEPQGHEVVCVTKNGSSEPIRRTFMVDDAIPLVLSNINTK